MPFTMTVRQGQKLTPLYVMECFAREEFDPPRKYDFDSFTGEWKGNEFAGTFKLKDGARVYRIACKRGVWTVSPHDGGGA